MEERDRQNLKSKVEEELATLAVDIERLTEQTQPIPPDRAIGRLTRMEAIQSKSIAEAGLRTAKARVRKLQRALQNLNENPDFGICQVCEEPIPVKRLLLVPESTRCVPCASNVIR